MRVIACIPYVNRPDLLRDAVASLTPFVGSDISRLYVLNNSGADLGTDAMILDPPVPLTFAQTQNWIQELAHYHQADVALFMHSDGVATPDAVRRVLAASDRDRIVFSHYDVLATFGADAMRRVGAWDTAIPWYYADNDWYRRARLAGVPIVEVGGDGVTHQNDASNTMKSDWRIAIATHAETIRTMAVYREKWGALPPNERYTVPYDGNRLAPPLSLLRDHVLAWQLTTAYQTTEDTLLELQDDAAAWAQVRAIAWAYECAGHPRRVIETGTAKATFGYLLSVIAPYPVHLTTIDGDARAVACAKLLADGQARVSVHALHGDSNALLTPHLARGCGLAWIDGGHDEATTTHDIVACLAAGVPWILVDDTQMETVRAAIQRALADYPGYRVIDHPWRVNDTRGITVLTCSI